MAEAKSKVPQIFLQLCDKRSSGFVKDGTGGTAFHEELNCPNVAWIPNTGKRVVMKKIDGIETPVFQNIRWINGCNTIDPQEQEKMGIKPNPKEDTIVFEKGYATISKEGATLSLYEFLEVNLLSKSNPNRPPNLEALYEVMQVDKIAEEVNEQEIMVADAISFVASLRVKFGDGYKYNESRLNTICELCQVHNADSPAQKMRMLMNLAKAKPQWFLTLVEKYEQTIITEIAHALDLKVIRLDGNSFLYEDGDKVIRALGAGNHKHEAKIQMLADYFGSKEGAEALTELRAKLEMAKQKALK